AQPGEPNLVGRDTEPGGAELPLRLLDGLPARLQRREVPALALPADDPQPPPRPVVRETAAHGERFEHLVTAEWLVAEQAGRVHGQAGPAGAAAWRGGIRRVICSTLRAASEYRNTRSGRELKAFGTFRPWPTPSTWITL